MPVSPELTVELVKGLVEVYTQSEQTLLRIVAARLAEEVDAPDWAERKLAEVGRLRQQALVELAKLTDGTRSGVDEILRLAWNRGAATAATDLAAAGVMPEMAFGVVNDSALTAMIRDLAGQLEQTHPRILRSVLDVYRDTIADASGQLLTGTQTRRQAAQRALDRFASRGITGFVDTRGRSWDLTSYTEMSLRSGAGRAVVEGHTERLVANGRDLVIVSDAPQECELCRPWEGKVLSITGATSGRLSDGTKVAGTLNQARSAGLFHANCFPGDVRVSGPAVRAADSRWYEGDLVVIHTAGGDELPVTPNHPILASEGWVAAGALNVGDQLVRHRSPERMHLVGPHDDRVEPPIGYVAGALRQAGPVVAMSVPAAAEQFHGDGLGGHVDVVLTNGHLEGGVDASLTEPAGDVALLVRGMRLSSLLAECSALEVGLGPLHPPHSVVGGADLSSPLVCRHGRPLPPLGLASADLRSPHLDPPADGALSDAEGGRQLRLALAGSVSLDEIVYVGRRQFAGHVYNLQTEDGWYTANGIVVHNCRHRTAIYIEGETRPMHDTADPEGDAARQQLRYLERGVRQWKRRAAVALDDDARKAAEAKAREWQARIREHVASSPAKRRPERERLGAR